MNETMKTVTFCPECGFGVDADEDGCCVTCGATAQGDALDRMFDRLADADQQHEESTRLLCELAAMTMIPVKDDDGEVIGLSSGCSSTHEEILEHLIARGEMVKMRRYGREMHAAWKAKEVK